MADLPKKKDLEATGDNYGFRMNGRLLVGGLIGVVLLAFILMNRETVPINFIFFKVDEAPLWIVLMGTALLGFAAGTLAVFTRRHKRRKARRAER